MMHLAIYCTLSLFTFVASCPQDQLVIYKMIFTTEWSEQRFPKQYPEYRPNAQWSKVIGETHSDSHRMWQLNELASPGVKLFAESARTDNLELQKKPGVFDNFYGPPIKVGVGRTETLIFLDGNHTKVSLMSRIIPSPDWFVGIDSFDLCSKNKWLDTVTIDLDPLDAGTQNGYTFTSPKWAAEPPNKITRITSQRPSHPANSFFYPELSKLPRLAYLQLIKTKEYELREVFQHDSNRNVETVIRTADFSEQYQKDEASGDQAIFNYIPVEQKKEKRKNKDGSKNKRRRRPRNCKVSEWSEWGSCSSSCNIGHQIRERKMVKKPLRNGKSCPPLREVKWCGSARNCRNDVENSYFDWNSKPYSRQG